MSTWILIPGACASVALILILHKNSRKAPNFRFWDKPSANLKTSDDRVSEDGRVSKTAEELELMITGAVKAAPGCEAFVGVVVQRITPKSRLDANWELRGTKFGQADRKIAREAWTPIAERMQQEFRLAED